MNKTFQSKVAKKPVFVQIRWLDAEDLSGWQILDDLPAAPRVNSWGWLVKETKESYYLAGTAGDDFKDIATIMQIPKAMTLKVTKWPKLTK